MQAPREFQGATFASVGGVSSEYTVLPPHIPALHLPSSGSFQRQTSSNHRISMNDASCKSLSPCLIDHITVTAASLAVGAAFVRNALGVSPQTGGEHPRMGTHNLLLRLGDALFLEVIAANPSAGQPARPRWFALDTLSPQSATALATWVVRTDDIHSKVSAASEALGNVEPMSRGSLDWLITIPVDGSLPLGGIAPTLIEWHSENHPAGKLDDHGLSLVKLELFHPEPGRIANLLQSLVVEAPVSILAGPASRLVAHIQTPRGLRQLPAAMPSLQPGNQQH